MYHLHRSSLELLAITRGLASFGLPTFYEYMMGGLVLPSHESTWEIESYTGSNLPFWQRLRNFVITWHNVHLYYNDMAVNHHSLAEKYLGKNIPFLPEVFENVSIMLINQNDVLSFARPKLPNLITFSSLHIYNDLPPLPKKLKRFVDDAKNGFIYFNLGSNARSSMLPRETRQIFLDVFAKLPYKVLWKFEKELPEKPDNVFTVSWIPQQTILAHPNIKLFMYQEGVQSTEEAVHYAIPVLGLPILGDQDHQRNRMKTLGVAEVLDVRTLTRDELESNIHKMINDKKYKENMLKLRSLAKDTPYNFAEYISWWIEFVIRHKGAPQFHSSLVRLPWYQRHDMDLIIFLTVVAYIVFLIAIVIIIKFVLHTYERYYPVQKQKTS
ncbi:UDP-glycosyltransferase UGT5-like isoform X2 [Ptiloglossa arizonensis]|uniref:UDP-glycosyltransferase UGT5-like isoform X2 n=1 Tax=Ptiloglossa arizonensis TaxID=3350558 RepID=UPI003FA0E340